MVASPPPPPQPGHESIYRAQTSCLLESGEDDPLLIPADEGLSSFLLLSLLSPQHFTILCLWNRIVSINQAQWRPARQKSTYLERILPRKGLVAPIARIWLDGPVYPLVPLEVVVPCKRRRTLVALVWLLGRPLLRLEHHTAKMPAVRAGRSDRGRVVRHQGHGPAWVAQVMHVLLMGLLLLLLLLWRLVVVRVVRQSSWPRRPRRWSPARRAAEGREGCCETRS